MPPVASPRPVSPSSVHTQTKTQFFHGFPTTTALREVILIFFTLSRSRPISGYHLPFTAPRIGVGEHRQISRIRRLLQNVNICLMMNARAQGHPECDASLRPGCTRNDSGSSGVNELPCLGDSVLRQGTGKCLPRRNG